MSTVGVDHFDEYAADADDAHRHVDVSLGLFRIAPFAIDVGHALGGDEIRERRRDLFICWYDLISYV